MPAPDRIKELVRKFEANFAFHQGDDYNEEDLRHEFLNPFFRELGWDLENEAGKGADRDVRYEKTIKSGAPDFGFYIDGRLKFFVEAKNPSKNVCDNPLAALQLRKYGWSAKIPRSILTDFEELSIYNTTIRPKVDDRASIARLGCIKYSEYVERWDEIAALFSRDAVLAGSLEKLAKEKAKQQVDDDFLEDISDWRELLAKNLALRNGSVTEEQVNVAVQTILDRIIFLRICEDRGIEPENLLSDVGGSSDVWSGLQKAFRVAATRYDSSLFRPGPEQDLTVDDKVLKEIISGLYFPNSPYAFAVVSADILGQVYEQFLGQVIRLTEGHHAKVEDKPEVRNAGGVFYTPTYIVDYIVKNTLGKVTEGKAPQDIEKLSVLDPACGSGSFLIGAYQYLMSWYRDWYMADGASKHEKAGRLWSDKAGEWQLTLQERKAILIRHIYGVDIDRQAVEVAKLSLMLKALEAPEQYTLFGERILPELDNNIKCGNSLVGTDYFAGRDTADLVESARVNPFDWEAEFSTIIKRSGFDVVIGNPPWIDIKGFDSLQTDYFFKRYHTVANRMNLYAVFMERSLGLLGENGCLGLITPNSFLSQSSYTKLREEILKYRIASIVRLPDNTFEGVSAESAISIMWKKAPAGEVEVTVFSAGSDIDRVDPVLALYSTKIDQSQWQEASAYAFRLKANGPADALLVKFQDSGERLDAFCNFSLGLTPYDKHRGHTPEQISGKVFHSTKKDGSDWKPLLQGGDIRRYKAHYGGGLYIKYGPWLGAPRQPRFFSSPRILVRQIISGDPPRIYAAYTDQELYNTQSIFNLVLKEGRKESLKYILGLLNSRPMTWLHRTKYLDPTKRVFQKILIQDAKELSIRPIDFSNLVEKQLHDDMVGLVERIALLESQRDEAAGESEQQALRRQVDAVDRQIDQLVYKLYGLSEEEIRIVEESAK